MVRAILFDLGDTLLDFEPMDTRAVFRAGSRSTYDLLKAKGCSMPPFPSYCRKQLAAIRWAYLWAKLRRREFNSLRLLRKLARRFGFQDDERTLVELAWHWYSPLIEHASIEEDLIPTLASLRGRGLKIGLVSNTFVPGLVLDRHLHLTGLLEFFPVRVYSSEIGYRKPDRRIFLAALNEIKVAPEEAMFVGDIVKTDIVGARRIGMKTVLKQPWSNSKPHRIADHVIRRISDLIGILDSQQPSGKQTLAQFTLGSASMPSDAVGS